MTQDAIFLESEADRWFERNHKMLDADCALTTDPVLRVLSESAIRPRCCLEVGASNGYRLEAIRRSLGASVTALEPSAEAIADGRRRFPGVRFVQGLAHALDFPDGSFDFVIVSFVLHWVDRTRLMRSVAELDRVLVDGGNLLIADFLPDGPERVPYHHLPAQDVWTYKQDYAAMLIASHLYRMVHRQMVDYRTREFSEAAPADARFAITLLQKSLGAGYRVAKLPETHAMREVAAPTAG
jgi:ubiquinone/menaquinone biosynthesis C-methylase UbiE